jgi:GntR family transcriptional regulator
MHTQDQILAIMRIEDSGVPIYVQLREQFLRIIAVGLLKPGDQMPTMRQVAVALKIDLNTVRHGYEELERLGAVVLARGRGSFVADRPPPPGDAARQDQIDTLVRQTLAAAASLGVDPRALAHRIVALATDKEDIR